MPFIRLNQYYNYDTRKYDIHSNICNSYRDEVEMLTASSLADMNISNYLDCYIKLPQHDELLYYLKKSRQNSLVYLTGVTGSGKTTLLEAVFQHENNNIVFKEKDTAIITFVWIPSDEDKKNISATPNNTYSNFLLRCVEKICKEYKIKMFYNENNKTIDEDFLKFIEQEDLSYYSQKKDYSTYLSLIKADAIKFAILALRYAISLSELKNIVFLFDELEEAGKGVNGEDLEIKVVELAYTIKSLMTDYEKKERKNKRIIVNRFTVLISCRHYVYRMITDKKEKIKNPLWTRINAEAQTEMMIDINNSPKLSELLEKRKNVIKEIIKSEKDKEEFEEVYKITSSIINQCGEIILALSIGNIRDAFKYVRYLLFNKRWLQRSEPEQGAFSIQANIKDYNLNFTSYLRALALRENTVYTQESIVPNLLDNTNGKNNLSILIVLSFFINKIHDPNIRNGFSSQFDIEEELKPKLDLFFNPKKQEYYNAFNFLLKERILLRSFNCCQEDSTDDPCLDDNFGEWKYVYISKLANELWRLLNQNSVLFEMFVDDVKLSQPIQTLEDINRRNYVQFNYLALKECIYYLDTLLKSEVEILYDLSAINYLNDYKNSFTKSLICRRLYNGLKKSCDSYYKTKDNDRGMLEYEELKRLLSLLDKKMNDVEFRYRLDKILN